MPALLLVILGAIMVFAPLIEKVFSALGTIIGGIIGIAGLLLGARIAFVVLSFLFQRCKPYLDDRKYEKEQKQRQREQEAKERQEEQEEEQKRKDIKWNYFLASIQNQEYGSAYSMIQENPDYWLDQTQEFQDMESLLKHNSEKISPLLTAGDYSNALSLLMVLKETPLEQPPLLEAVQHYVKLKELRTRMESLSFNRLNGKLS